MTRILIFLIIISAISLAGMWLLDHDTILTMNWLGYRIEASLFFIVATIIGTFITGLLLVLLLLWLGNAPHRMAKHYADIRREKGMVALTQGFAAIASGDIILAKKLAKHAGHRLGKTPLTLLLQTQAAQLAGNDTEVKQQLSLLLEHKETELIALKGMLLQAQKSGDINGAITLAERAYALNPDAVWVVPILTDLYKYTKSWQKARRTLEDAVKRKTIHPGNHNRMLGILLLSEAEEKLQAGDAEAALNFSYRANKLLPGFVPAAVTLGAILLQLGKKRKAAHMLEQHWETSPHPDLAKAYMALYAGEPEEKQLKHVERLVASNENHPESHRIIAQYALLAENLSKARNHLKLLLQMRPTVSAYQLMYEVDKHETGIAAEILQQWLDKAAKAEQDAAWVCKECGYSTKERWSQNCSNCNHFDTYQWKEASAVHVITKQG